MYLAQSHNIHGRPPMLNRTRLVLALLASTAFTGPAEARITRLEINSVEPAFGGQAFGATGAYERLLGKAYGEVDPKDVKNAIIQDIALSPRNARGMVEYRTDLEILRPADRQKGNGTLFFNVVNRGNKHGIVSFNADVPQRPADLGDNNALKNAGPLRHVGIERDDAVLVRSEEHTSELQSPVPLVCRLLL